MNSTWDRYKLDTSFDYICTIKCSKIILPETFLFLKAEHDGNVKWWIVEEQLSSDG